MAEQFVADPSDPHYTTVINAITRGQVIPFLGAGANRCDRPANESWERGRSYLPDGGELSKHLAEYFMYPAADTDNLVRVSQYAAVMNGSGPLYEELHSILESDYLLTPLHKFFAALPSALREKGYPPRHQLIVTTNYDDLMEQAFRAVNEPVDVVSYITEGSERGKFEHQLPDGEVRLIKKPNEYCDLSPEKRTVILKIHGTVD